MTTESENEIQELNCCKTGNGITYQTGYEKMQQIKLTAKTYQHKRISN